jgi:hypothetical protein
MEPKVLNMADAGKYKRSLGFLFEYLIDKKVNEIRQWVKPTMAGYDIGAGLGQYTKRLWDLGYDVIGLEPMMDFCREGVHPLINVPGEYVNIEKDYAYMINVLHHAENPYRLLHHLRTKVKLLIVSEINGENPFVGMYVRLRMPWENFDGHFSRNKVRDMLIGSGWKIKYSYKRGLLGVPNVYNWFVCTPLTWYNQTKGVYEIF